MLEREVLDHGYVRLHNIASMIRRPEEQFDAKSGDPAQVARVSFNNLLDSGKTPKEDIQLTTYLQNHHHTTPIEFTTVWLEFKMPLFVARQFDTVRTRSKNELSGRYKELPREWYLPEIVRGKPAEGIKQGSGEPVDSQKGYDFNCALDEHCESSWRCYDIAISEGIAPELARLFLHLNNYTIFAWKQDLHNLCNNFLRLRLDPHTQWETREYAFAIHSLLSEALPEWMSLWDDQQNQEWKLREEVAHLRKLCTQQQQAIRSLTISE